MKKVERMGEQCYHLKPTYLGQLHLILLGMVMFISGLLILFVPEFLISWFSDSPLSNIFDKYLLAYNLDIFYFFSGIAFVLLSLSWLKVFMYDYYICKDHIEEEYGIIMKNTSSLKTAHIRSVEVKQNVFERLLGFGDVSFASSGTAGAEVVFFDIKNPSKIASSIEKII